MKTTAKNIHKRKSAPTLIVLGSLLLACSEPEPFITSGDPAVDSLATAAFPKLVAACPGLMQYQDDLSEIKAEPAMMSRFSGGVLFTVTVSNNPTHLPRYAARHNCFYTTNQTGDKLAYSKRACRAVCTGEWPQTSKPTYWELPLQ